MSRVVLVHFRGGAKLVEHVVELMRRLGIEHVAIERGDLSSYEAGSEDIVAVLGSDRDFLESLQLVKSSGAAFMLISPPGYTSFFSTANWDSLSDALARVNRGEYFVERYMRLLAEIDGSAEYYALNELAIFSDKSGVAVSYTLEIDGETMWRDSGDGLIVSTPIGSTAYALSAGGPIVVKNAPVIVVVPVNSMNPLRKPLVVPGSSTISVRNLESRVGCVAIVDGVVRRRIRRSVEIKRAAEDLRVIRLESRLSESILRKRTIALEIEDLPPSAKFILKMLEIHGDLSFREIVSVTNLPGRTVRHALRVLLEKGLIDKYTSLRDARLSVYRLRREGEH